MNEKTRWAKSGCKNIEKTGQKAVAITITVLKFNLSKLWIHECGKDATRYPSEQGRYVWVTKAFAYFWPIKSKVLPTQASFSLD